MGTGTTTCRQGVLRVSVSIIKGEMRVSVQGRNEELQLVHKPKQNLPWPESGSAPTRQAVADASLSPRPGCEVPGAFLSCPESLEEPPAGSRAAAGPARRSWRRGSLAGRPTHC